MRKFFIFFLVFIFSFYSNAQETAIDKLFRSSYRVWELQRNDIGMYRDSKLFNGADYHPCSVANVGIGLISLCIADSMKWDESALGKALLTLKSITGHTAGFNPDRNASGFFRHFINMKTGLREWNSEYSTIDTEILVSGALFAKNYFQNDSISKYVMELWDSVEHEKAIADADNGKIFLTMESNGQGTSTKLTSVYNEYMIVAWMAKNATIDINSPAHILWNKYYSDPDDLPTTEFYGSRVLTDRAGYFLSSFTHQFNYYLCHYFTTSEKYLNYFEQSRKADSDWWKYRTTSQDWEWGCGAGTDPTGYSANKINDNLNQVISPQIIAGYLPVFPESENQLRDMWLSQKGRYVFPNYPSDVLLWRYSLTNSQWQATEIQGIDYSTMLFGLATLPQFLGKSFFAQNNDFFSDQVTKTYMLNIPKKDILRLLSNPVNDILKFEVNDYEGEVLYVEIINIQQQILFSNKIKIQSDLLKEKIQVADLVTGVYFLSLSLNGKVLATKKFIKK